jgi:hypothetical protein
MAQQRPVKRHRPASTEKLPEPAKSLGRKVSRETSEQPGQKPEGQAAEQMEEWVASRAPGARPAPKK